MSQNGKGANGKYESLITPDTLLLIKGWARDGANDKEICKNLGIAYRTYYKYRQEHKEFDDAINEGRRPIIVTVEDTFFSKKLQGYTVTEKTKEKTVLRDASGNITGSSEHIRENERYIPPDTGAIIFFLKCRMKEKYNEIPNAALTEKKLKAEIALYEKKIEALSGSDNTALEILDQILDGVHRKAMEKESKEDNQNES